MKFLWILSLFVLFLQRSTAQPSQCNNVSEEYKSSNRCEEDYCGERPRNVCSVDDPEVQRTLSCYCSSGYIRRYVDGPWNCVPISECPKCSGAFEELTCSTSCEEGYCGQRPNTCSVSKCSYGCYCSSGYARRNGPRRGPCVAISKCPKCRGGFEEYKCSTSCEEGFCGQAPTTICEIDNRNDRCSFGCYCSPGYVRKYGPRGGPCVLAYECPRCLRDFEEYKCNNNCDFAYCGQKPGDKCQIGGCNCYCSSGYVRRDGPGSGPCVPISKCPRCLGDFEEYKCSFTCEEGYCGKPPITCSVDKCSYGCYCSRGYVRRDGRRAGPCIPENKCVEQSRN